jgi:hypothetical protein
MSVWISSGHFWGVEDGEKCFEMLYGEICRLCVRKYLDEWASGYYEIQPTNSLLCAFGCVI